LSDVNAQLLVNPGDEGNLALKEVLEEEIPKLEAEVNTLKAAPAVAVASGASGNLAVLPLSTNPADLSPLPPSPADTTSSPTVASPPPAVTNTNSQPVIPLQVFQVGDAVQAKWTDGKWYAAIVLSKTGSSKNPMYFVQYKDYDERATVPSKDVKPPYDWKMAKKRKAEEELTRSSNNSTVISRPSTVDPKLAAQAKKQNKSVESATSTNHAKVPKLAPSKIYKNIDKKGLEKAQSNWQDFSKNSKWAKKNKHKESQFRVGEGAGARGKSLFWEINKLILTVLQLVSSDPARVCVRTKAARRTFMSTLMRMVRKSEYIKESYRGKNNDSMSCVLNLSF
jgi:hypothetical protein